MTRKLPITSTNATLIANILSQLPDAVIVSDFEDTVLLWNRGAERLFGRSSAEMIGQHLPTAGGMRWFTAIRQNVNDSLLQNGKWRWEEVHIADDGRETSLECEASFFKDDLGVDIGYLTVVRDVSERIGRKTDRNRASKLGQDEAQGRWVSLRDGGGILEIFLENLPFCAYVKDEQGRHIFHNRATRDMAHFTADSLGSTDEDLFGPEVGGGYRETDLKVLNSGRPMQTVERFNVDGSERSFLSVKFPILDANKDRFLGGVSIDITDDIRDQAELRKRAALLDLANDAIFVTELDGTITYWNLGAEKLYGYAAAEAVGKEDIELLCAIFHTPFEDARESLLRDGHWEGEVTRRGRNREPLIVSSRWSLLRDLNGIPVARMVINTDLTATKLAFEELRRAEADARARAAELAAVLDVIPGATFIAHDAGCRTITSSRAAYALLRVPHGSNTSKSAADEERPTSFRITKDGRELEPDELPLQQAAALGKPVLDAELTLVFDDGSSRDVLGNAVPLTDSSGKVIGAAGCFIDITERNAALNEVRAQKAILRTILDNTSDFVFLKDCSSRYLAINPAAARSAGKTQEECLGKDDYAIFPADVAKRHIERDQEVIVSGSSMTYEDEIVIGGQTRTIQTVKNLCRDATGTLIGVVGTSRDFTEQKATEAALRKSQALFRKLFDSDLIGVGCGKISGAMTDANDKFLELVGYTRDDLVQGRMRWDSMTPEKYAPLDQAGISEAALRGTCTPYQKELIRKDGGRLPVLVGYALEESSELLIGFILDLSAQELAEEALREREQRFRALAETLPQLIWTADANGKKTYCNQRYFEYTGLSSVEEMDTLWSGVIHPDDREATKEAWNFALKNGEPYLKEYRLRRHDGVYRHYLARALPLRNEAGEIEQWLGSITDIHDQKLGEEVLRRTEKLAATGRLAASIAHEINNPLNAAGNVLYLALQDQTLSSATRQYLRLAEHELARVANATTQTLRFHKQSSRPAPTDLCEIMESALLVFRPRFQDCAISLEREYRTHQKLYCYDSELRQVFVNLLSNSLDATDRGGRVRIRISLSRAWDKVRTRGIKVIVADTGQGIPMHLRKDVFEPFVSTKEATSTGLGLWVSNGIMQHHNGRISLRSSTNAQRHGTVFSLFFPFIGVAE